MCHAMAVCDVVVHCEWPAQTWCLLSSELQHRTAGSLMVLAVIFPTLQLLDRVLVLEGQHPVLPRHPGLVLRHAAVGHVAVLLPPQDLRGMQWLTLAVTCAASCAQ